MSVAVVISRFHLWRVNEWKRVGYRTQINLVSAVLRRIRDTTLSPRGDVPTLCIAVQELK